MNRIYDALPIFAQNVACTAAGWTRVRQRFTPYFWRTLERWNRSLRAPEEELHALQALRLAELLDYSRANVPQYRDLPPMRRTADPAEAIAATLAEVPVLEKETYRDAPERFLSRAVARHQLIRGRTSGTTGSALRLWYTSEAVAEEYATVWRMRMQHGVSPRDPHLTFGGRMVVPFRVTEPPFHRKDASLHQTLFSLYHMSEGNLQSYVDAIHTAEAHYAQGYPSSLHLVARALLAAGRPLARGRLKAVFTSSETVLASQRRAIEAGFGAPLLDRYGASEFAVSMTSCSAGSLHVDMEYCVVEMEVEEETPEWARGPLLVTGLANRATPLIRYRIGDIGTRRKRPCPCGRAGDAFLSVDGRVEDYVVTPDGRVVGRLDHVFKDLTDIAEAQIVQTAKDRIVVSVVPLPGYSEASERALLRELHARLGHEMAMRVDRVGSIPRQANGKLRAVKSLLPDPRLAL